MPPPPEPPSSQHLLNEPADAIAEMIEGLVLFRPSLRRLAGLNAVVRASSDPSQVAIVSGGGAGHEPSHAGWVGAGMLSAAVSGSVFASPSMSEVLAAILHVTGPAGCLVVVKNYTGDRLNFGLACEHAKARGLGVEMVVVGDDCALPDRGLGIGGRRGLAGTVLVHKVAGAAAAAGATLAQVAAEARAAAASVGTVGVGLKTCHPFGSSAPDRIPFGQMELGLGIHGEPGASMSPLLSADAVVDALLASITSTAPGTSYLPLSPGDKVALLVNNLGGTTPIELSIAARRALQALRSPPYSLDVARAYCGPFMTALDMCGLSLSLMKLDENRLARLDAPAEPPAWPSEATPTPAADAVPLPPPALPESAQAAQVPRADESTPPVLTEGEQAAAMGAVRRAAEAVAALEPKLTEYDSKVGDGDCGSTMLAGARAVLSDSPSYACAHPASLLAGVGYSIGRAMGGTSGVLYSIFFSAVAASVLGMRLTQAPTPAQMAEAFAAGVEAVGRYGGARLGDRTMLDALLPAALAATSSASSPDATLASTLAAAAAAATQGAANTRGMAAAAGRSSYVNADVLRDVPDPGAVAVAGWMEALALRRMSE